MLCDDLVNADGLDNLASKYDNVDLFISRISAANKFVLSSDLAHAADGLVSNVKELERILPFCRLPYPDCWFELAHHDRPGFVNATTPLNEWESPPKRIGFLLNALDPQKLNCWRAHMFWSFVPGDKQAGKFNACMISMVFDTTPGADVTDSVRELRAFKEHLELSHDEAGTALARAICPDIAAFGHKFLSNLIKIGMMEKIIELSASDWSGEARFIIAMLGLINAKNVVELDQIDNTEWNRKRAKRGQHPLASHHVVKISHIIKRRMEASQSPPTNEAERRDQMRAHFVRGHFKARKSGIFWWNPFMRGNLQKGYVSKEYVVTDHGEKITDEKQTKA